MQSTRVNGYISSESKLQCGTAQESTIVLYFDTFGYVRYNESLNMCADNTLLIEQGDTKVPSINACQIKVRWMRFKHDANLISSR